MSEGGILCNILYKPKEESESHKKTRDDRRNEQKTGEGGGGLRKAKNMRKQENKVSDENSEPLLCLVINHPLRQSLLLLPMRLDAPPPPPMFSSV